MHMFFAGFALHLLVVVAAYVSSDLTDKPSQCAVLGILIHYFLLAHFCWIFVQVLSNCSLALVYFFSKSPLRFGITIRKLGWNPRRPRS